MILLTQLLGFCGVYLVYYCYMDQNLITYLGKVDHHNKMTKFGIRTVDRAKHMYIIGKTGTGKSTFLENMIVQDIQNGNGLAFIDPHGTAASKILDYIPEWRINDVIYFDPADMEFPIAFNPLEDVGPERRHLVVDGLMSVFKKIWPEAFSGRMEYILNNTMLALLEYPEPTILSINRMLIDKEFRKKVVANITDATVKNAWDELQKWDDKRWSEAAGSLINKVGQFTTNPVIRNIIGQAKSTFDFRKAMDERKIIIINLSKGMIGEQNAPLLGAMLITKIYLAAMSRADLSPNVMAQMPPFYFYVDEFQNFANDSFASILSEARKYKLALTVANQYIAQMEETIRDAVFGNMGTTIAFRVGPLDAEFMEKVFAPVFTQDNLQNIVFRQFYITLQIDGMGSKPFSAQSLDMIMPLQTSLRDRVIEASRKQFARPRMEVNKTIIDWFGYGKKTEDKTIRSDVGNPNNPMGKPPVFDRSTPQTQAYTPTTPRSANASVQNRQPLPPITGYRADQKPVSATASRAESKPNPAVRSEIKSEPKPIPVKTSDTLKDLLGKLDAPAFESKAESKPESKPELKTQGVGQAVLFKIPSKDQGRAIQSSVDSESDTEKTSAEKPVQKPAVFAPADSKLSRAATPEKKSALAEALAKALADKKPDQKPIHKTGDLDVKPDVQKNTTPKPEQMPESIPEPALKKPSETVATANPFVSDIPKAPVQPEPQFVPQPPRDSVASDQTPESKPFTFSKTPKEVPEDILRKVLE